MLPNVFILILAALFSCCEAALQCSVPDNGVSYMPDVPASVTDLGTTVNTNGNFLYIYPGGSPGCNGTVTGVEYCYRRGETSSSNIFTILVMSRVRSSEEDIFTVTREIPIPTPTGQCSDGTICCDSYNFTNEQFDLAQDDFNIGVLTPSGTQQVIAFHSSQSQYVVNVYQLIILANVGLNEQVAVTVAVRTMLSLRIMRLIVESSSTTTPVLTTQPVTDPTDTTQASTTPEPTTSNPTTDNMAQTTDPDMGLPKTTNVTDGTTITRATSAPPAANDNTVPILAGVIVGLLVALLLVVVMCSGIVVVVCVRKRKLTTDHNPTAEGTGSAIDGRNQTAYHHGDPPVPTAVGTPTDINDAQLNMDVETAHMYETISDTPAGVSTFKNPVYRCVRADHEDYGYVNEGMGGLAEMTRCEAYGTVQDHQQGTS